VATRLALGNGAVGDRIRIPKVADIVAETLRRKIVTGEYEIGELLPPETALMAAFDVARTTIRDALRVLETEGLVEVRRGGGGGGRVRAPSTSLVADYAAALLQFQSATLADVNDARTMIEAPAAGLLAREKPAEAAATLRTMLTQEDEAEDDAALVRAEGLFHSTVVELTGNRVLMLLSGVANRLIADQVARVASKRRGSKDQDFSDAHKAHIRLVELIAKGEADKAENLWRRHLDASKAMLAHRAGGAKTVLDLLP
jgi:DNA-binding FadR family transcriptional regulator